VVEDSAGDNNTRTACHSAMTMTVVVAVGPGQGESAHFSAYSAYSTVTINIPRVENQTRNMYMYIYTRIKYTERINNIPFVVVVMVVEPTMLWSSDKPRRREK